MAVYTHISSQQFEDLLTGYDIGNLRAFKGITAGMQNTNYFLQTDKNDYILTVYEKLVNHDDLPFFMQLMEHLATAGIPCPLPIHNKNGEVLNQINDSKFAITSFLHGSSPKTIRNSHCYEVGKALAQMHNALSDFTMQRVNMMGQAQWRKQLNSYKDKVDTGLSAEIEQALTWIEANWTKTAKLPSGVIHADLFPDNIFFQQELFSGLLDFYFSCNDFLAYDVAITMNAWCFEHGTEFNVTKAKALLKGYNNQRPFTQDELTALPVLCAGAAMCFLLSRLDSSFNQVDGAVVTIHDPQEYLKKLRFHLQVKSYKEYGL